MTLFAYYPKTPRETSLHSPDIKNAYRNNKSVRWRLSKSQSRFSIEFSILNFLVHFSNFFAQKLKCWEIEKSIKVSFSKKKRHLTVFFFSWSLLTLMGLSPFFSWWSSVVEPPKFFSRKQIATFGLYWLSWAAALCIQITWFYNFASPARDPINLLTLELQWTADCFKNRFLPYAYS